MTMHVVQGQDGLARRAFTADDVRRMTEAGILGENDPFELVEGELIQMAAKGFGHDRVRDRLCRSLIQAVGPDIGVSVEGTLQLSPMTLVEPDLLVYREVEATPSAEGFKVVPGAQILLAIEVANTSLAYDRRRKVPLYAAYGVPEYWIVDLNRPRTFIHRRPSGSGYADVREAPGSELLSAATAELERWRTRIVDLL